MDAEKKSAGADDLQSESIVYPRSGEVDTEITAGNDAKKSCS